MKKFRLDTFTKGWFIGDFDNTIVRTKDFEIAVKRYKMGYFEARHTHRVATEFTLIVSGFVMMNGEYYSADDIIQIDPGESTDFKSITDSVTVCVKIPSVIGDKYMFDEPLEPPHDD